MLLTKKVVTFVISLIPISLYNPFRISIRQRYFLCPSHFTESFSEPIHFLCVWYFIPHLVRLMCQETTAKSCFAGFWSLSIWKFLLSLGKPMFFLLMNCYWVSKLLRRLGQRDNLHFTKQKSMRTLAGFIFFFNDKIVEYLTQCSQEATKTCSWRS